MVPADTDPCADEVFTLSADRASDPDGSKLYAVLDAHLAYDQARARRRHWVFLLVAACALSWLLGAPWAVLLPAWVSALVPFACVAVVLCATVAGLIEWQRYSRWMRAMTERGAQPAPAPIARHI